MNKNVLTIAGFDPSANAGILRDLQVFHLAKLNAHSVVTALTYQTKTKFLGLKPVTSTVFNKQLKSLGPLKQFGAIKIGMLATAPIVLSLAQTFRKQRPPIVLDPVYQSSTGGKLLSGQGRKTLLQKLVPLVSVWTPNKAEAEFFWGRRIRTLNDVEQAALELYQKTSTPIYIKSFFKADKVIDVFYDGRQYLTLDHPKIKISPQRQRGTGCALASLMASYLAKGSSLPQACRQAHKSMKKWLENQNSL